jgi:hypothetical protein
MLKTIVISANIPSFIKTFIHISIDEEVDCQCWERNDETISFPNPQGWEMCWRSQSRFFFTP